MQVQQKQTGNPKVFFLFFGVLLAAFAALLYATLTAQPQNPPQVAGIQTQDGYVTPSESTQTPSAPTLDTQTQTYKVIYVVDGDTIKVDIGGKTETVRLIGVDTPETKDPRKPVQCFGKEASNYTSASLLDKKIRLEPDSTQQNRDKYGRLLRYVYVGDTLFNKQLIADGFAYEYTYQVPYLFRDDFVLSQEQAQANGMGLWNKNTCNGKK